MRHVVLVKNSHVSWHLKKKENPFCLFKITFQSFFKHSGIKRRRAQKQGAVIMINDNENVGNYTCVPSSSALQSVLQGRVIIITQWRGKNNLCLCNFALTQSIRRSCSVRLLKKYVHWDCCAKIFINETLHSCWHGRRTCWEHPPSHHPLHSSMISIWTFLCRTTFLCISISLMHTTLWSFCTL